MAFYSGKDGSFKVGAAAWRLREWTLDMDTAAVDTTNFESGGFKENIAGLTGGTITARGPYDSAAMALTSGTSYTVTLTVGGLIDFAVPARVTKISLTTNVEGKAEVSITAETNGSFTASIT